MEQNDVVLRLAIEEDITDVSNLILTVYRDLKEI